MPAFKGKDGSGWKDASAIYGKNSSGWQYGKEAFVKNASGWQRVWTDCRLYDAGGRDWSSPSTVITYSGSCNNRTQTTTVTRTKTGCPPDVRATTVSSPDCNSSCFTASAVNCDGCGSATLYTANSGSGCTTYTSGSCGDWSTLDPYTYSTYAVSGGAYSHVTGTIWGWLYSDSSGTIISGTVTCGYQDYALAAGGVQSCSVGGYRVTGSDSCVYLSV